MQSPMRKCENVKIYQCEKKEIEADLRKLGKPVAKKGQ
jgi:hypothetical protein